MFQRKRRMSLREYLNDTKRPERCFTEDKHYIIFRNRPDGLRIVIDKNTYYINKPRIAQKPYEYLLPSDELCFFDMLAVNYQLPHIPVSSSIRIMLGQYYVSPEGPTFFLTEPKNARAALIFNLPKYPDNYRVVVDDEPTYDNQSYSDEDCQVIPEESIFSWISESIYIPQPPKGELEEYKKKCQINFQKQLDAFCQA